MDAHQVGLVVGLILIGLDGFVFILVGFGELTGLNDHNLILHVPDDRHRPYAKHRVDRLLER